MLGSTFDNGIELFDRRFITNAYLPMLLSTTGFGFVVLGGSHQLDTVARAFDALSPITQGGALLAWLGISWFLAGLLWNSRYSITRLYEGYGFRRTDGWSGNLRHRLCRRQRNIAEFFDGAARYRRYPMRPGDFLPTSFGNAMRASEFYGHHRYGLDLIVVWPRLAELAPDRYRADADEARSEYEFLLCLSFLGFTFGALSGTYLVLAQGSLFTYIATVPTNLVLGFAAYRLAVFAAIDYGDQLRVVVDMYRHRVIASLGWPPPTDETAERATWKQINEFLGQGTAVPGGRPLVVATLVEPPVEPAATPDSSSSSD